MAVDLDSMTPREVTAGLMRGRREKLQLGYTAVSAAFAAARTRGLVDFHADDEVALREPVLRDDLIPYAEGFEDGMADSLERSPGRREWLRPRESYVRHTDDPEYIRTRAYEEGLRDGQREYAPSLYPALRKRELPDVIQRFPERDG